MNYNQWKDDIYSLNDSCNAIACRQDLEPNPSDRYPFGAIDSKVSSVTMSSTIHDHDRRHGNDMPLIYAQLGPSHRNMPAFCWDIFDTARNRRGERFFHIGHPDCFAYDWLAVPPFHQD